MGSIMTGQNCMANEETRQLNGKNGENHVVKKETRAKPSSRHSLKQVLELQSAVYEAGSLLREDIKSASADERSKLASSLATLATSWTRLQDIKQQIQGKGKPMPVPSKLPNRKPATYDIGEVQPNSPAEPPVS